jgi:hypothetical protein
MQKKKRRRRLDPKIIRVGDIVRVVNPIFFDRCVYENNIKDVTEKVMSECRNEIEEFILRLAGILKSRPIELGTLNYNLSAVAIYKVARVIAYEIVSKKKIDGAKKMLFIEEYPDYKGQLFMVGSIKQVQTGVYVSRYRKYRGFSDEIDDYEPAYLSEVKCHKILSLRDTNGVNWWSGNELRIEATNVEKIMPAKNSS